VPEQKQAARASGASGWCDRDRGAQRPPPYQGPPLQKGLHTQDATGLERAKQFDCIGEKSEAKATRHSLQPAELPAAQLAALREDSKCEGIPDSEKCGRFESERRYLRRPRTRLKSVPE